MNLQNQIIESADKLEVFVMCPGLSKEEITISFDKKEGILEVQGTPKESSLSENVELNIKGKMVISPKYRADKIIANVKNGILTITFGLSDQVSLIEVKEC